MADVEMDEVIEDIVDEVERGGFTVAAIAGDGSGIDWAYTIGLQRNHGHPELLLVGVDAPLAGVVLQHLGDTIAAGRSLADELVIDLRDGVEFRVHQVDELFLAHGDWFVLGRAVTESWGGRWPATLQLVWRDHDGDFPDRAGDRRWMLRQPLLCGTARRDG